MKFEVVSNVYEWKDNGILGALHIELDGKPFPEKRWSGSVSETLIMWAENLYSLLDNGPNSEEEFFFPNSPYSFTVHQSGASLASLSLLHNAKAMENTPFEVSFTGIVSAVFYLMDAIACDERFEEIQQIRRLKNMAARLKSAAQAHGYHIE